MADRLKGRAAAITGAAQGNGRAFAEAFAEEGARVLVVDIRQEAAEQTAAEIGHGAVALAADVRRAADAELIVAESVRRFGGLDVFVNNAGVIGRVDFLELSEDEWDRVMDINLKGTFLCGQAAARRMVAQGRGSIINVASVNAESLNPATVHYCTTKGAVRTLTKGMALALARHGVRVNAIGPGPVRTALSRDRLEDPKAYEATVAHIPMGRVAEPEDLKGAAVFLASDESAYVTGITLFVDGGWLTI
jgi:NAD(P)-dependent dehydrogenase (short-subunit alcohol dehydrogenase family)